MNTARWFEEKVFPHEPQLRAFLHRQFPTLRDTDDLVQEVYLKIRRARRSDQIRSVKSYLFGIARNAALSLFRRKRVAPVPIPTLFCTTLRSTIYAAFTPS